MGGNIYSQNGFAGAEMGMLQVSKKREHGDNIPEAIPRWGERRYGPGTGAATGPNAIVPKRFKRDDV